MKKITFKSPTIFAQIADRLRAEIASGVYSPGERLHSVRRFAEELGVTPNTVQKALTLLGEEGLITSESTAGRFVTENTEVIENLRKKMRNEIALRLCNAAIRFGFNRDELIRFVDDYFDSKGHQ